MPGGSALTCTNWVAEVTSSLSMMDYLSARRLALIGGCCLLTLTSACERKAAKPAPAVSPTPTSTPSVLQVPRDSAVAAPITAPITPAVVDQKMPDSIAGYLHFPKNPGVTKEDAAVQFYCDVTETGAVETVHALVAKSEPFKEAVQTALDWGRFAPATVNGKAVRVYLGGTVLFLHENGEEVIVVSLATHERERVSKMVNYIQPQLIGGLRHALEKEIARLTKGVLLAGRAEVVVQVDHQGKVTATSGISENPNGSGLGSLLAEGVRHANFTPAYENAKPTTGAINVVADFSKF